jgi:two-component system nitrate/nitrite sensor histidine kinase NarX
MALSPEFYTRLSDIFNQIIRTPRATVTLPFESWPAGSPEHRLLIEFQTAILAIQMHEQEVLEENKKKGLLYQSVFESNCIGVVISDLTTGRVLEVNPTICSMLDYQYSELIGKNSIIYIHPASLTLHERCLQAVRGEKVFYTELIYQSRDGTPLNVDVSATQINYQERICMLEIVRNLREINERIQTGRLVQQQVEVRTFELATVLEVSQTLSSTLDIDPELILDQVRKVIAYTQAFLFTVEESTLVALAARGPQKLEKVIPIQIRIDGPEILGILFNGHQTTRIGNVGGGDPTAIFLRSLMKNKAKILLEGVQSWMWVPLAVKDRILGGLGIAHQQLDYFTSHQADLVQTIANQAAITMANAELYEHAQMFAALQERQRLARSLHDAVNQSLFSASLIAEVLPRLWEQNQEEGRRSLEDLRRLTQGAMAEMRMMMAELRPMALSDMSIHDLLCLLSDAFTGRTALPVHVNVRGDFSFPTDVQVVLYRLCQEGLSNIGKHAEATQADITLQNVDGIVSLVINDNGCGFDPEHTSPGHYGLIMMKERAESIGATLSVKSEIGKGTNIEIRWAENLDWIQK